jgi:hypothetical protein
MAAIGTVGSRRNTSSVASARQRQAAHENEPLRAAALAMNRPRTARNSRMSLGR